MTWRPVILRHGSVCRQPYDVLEAAIHARRWAFGVSLADYRDRTARHQYTLRVMCWRWHLIWHLTPTRD